MEFLDRSELDAVQKRLREMPGTTVLIYDQTCATEKRRRRKRGKMVDPQKRVLINSLVCEGCGDCGKKSFCVSVLPKETEFGRKREIDQSNCNKDYSCVNGFCPSFVTVHGGTLRKQKGSGTADRLANLPAPTLPALDQPWNILITGVGGTGVVTIGALLGMAGHLEGKGASVLDQTGLAQKGGAVTTHIRIAKIAGRHPRRAHRRGRSRPRARLRHGGGQRLLAAVEDPQRPHAGRAQQLRSDAGHVHHAPRHAVPRAGHRRGDQARARRRRETPARLHRSTRRSSPPR